MRNNRTLGELADAEIVPDQGGNNAYLVRFGEGEYDLVNKSAKNTLILKDEVNLSDTEKVGSIRVSFDLQGDSITLSDSRDSVTVPSEKHEHVLWSVHDDDEDRLRSLFDELNVPSVRTGLMDQFMPRFRDGGAEVRKTADGWVVNDEVLVSWDGSNHPVDVQSTFTVNGGQAVEADESKPARELAFDPIVNDGLTAEAPDGRTFDLTEVEANFLTTVGLATNTGSAFFTDDLSEAIVGSEVTSFTDARSGLHHGHGIDKHRLTDLGVTEAATDKLYFNSYDHTGVWEMAQRRDEFENAPIDVFEDAPNDDPDKWRNIENTREKAPIPEHIRTSLQEMYE